MGGEPIYCRWPRELHKITRGRKTFQIIFDEKRN